MRPSALVWFPTLALLAGCVSSGKYDSALADAAKAQAQLRQERATEATRAAADRKELASLREQVAAVRLANQQTLGELNDIRGRAATCAKGLDETTALNAGLRKELERLGKDVDQLLSAKGTLASSLDQARARLDELRRAQTAAEARAALFRDVALRLKRMLDAGDLQIALRSGRMVLVLPNDVLFDSGKAELKPRGKETLAAVAEVLSTLDKRRFQVAGHTDDDPIRYSGFPSNWELSTARALAVVNLLVKSGMRPETLSAAGYGQFDPVQANDSADNKAKNRRTEITLQPNIDELVALPSPR
ncbi:MAG: OmpA family protein [Myxococcales bacterium]